MQVTATEFKAHLSKYYELVSKTDIYITKNGKEIAKLTKPVHDRTAILDDLVGILPEDAAVSENEIKEERLAKQ